MWNRIRQIIGHNSPELSERASPRLSITGCNLTTAIESGQEQPELSFSSDGQMLLSSCADTKAWKVDSGQLLWTAPGWAGGISPDNGTLLTLDRSAIQTVCLCSMLTGEVLTAREFGDMPILWLSFLPEGDTILIVCGKPSGYRHLNNGRFVFLDIPTLEVRAENPVDLNITHEFCLLPNGKELLTMEDGESHGWDIYSGTCLRTLPIAEVDDVKIAPSGESIVTCNGWIDDWNTVDIRDGITGKRCQHLQSEPIHGIALSGNGDLLVGCGGKIVTDEGVIQFWDMETGTLLRTITGSDAGLSDWGSQWEIALSQDSRSIATGDYNGQKIYLWNLQWEKERDSRVIPYMSG